MRGAALCKPPLEHLTPLLRVERALITSTKTRTTGGARVGSWIGGPLLHSLVQGPAVHLIQKLEVAAAHSPMCAVIRQDLDAPTGSI